MAFVYDYEYEHGKSFLTINGRRYGEARAFAPQGITSRKIIGRHAWKQIFFHGDLAELLIFNKALSADELAADHDLSGRQIRDRSSTAVE